MSINLSVNKNKTQLALLLLIPSLNFEIKFKYGKVIDDKS